MGRPTVIEYEREGLESQRLYAVAPSVAVNLLLVLAALGSLALFASQRTQREYLFLSIFFIATGLSNGLWHLQQAGVLLISANFLFADPLGYLVSIAQIEFTLSFARRRLGAGWRIYEVLLLLPVLLVPLAWLGHFSPLNYVLVQVAVTASSGVSAARVPYVLVPAREPRGRPVDSSQPGANGDGSDLRPRAGVFIRWLEEI